MSKTALLKQVESNIKTYDNYLKELKKKKSPIKNSKTK